MKRICCAVLVLCLLAGLLARSNPGMLASASVLPPYPNPQYPISNTQYPISNTPSFTISGTLRDPDGLPVPGVPVGVSTEDKWV